MPYYLVCRRIICRIILSRLSKIFFHLSINQPMPRFFDECRDIKSTARKPFLYALNRQGNVKFFYFQSTAPKPTEPAPHITYASMFLKEPTKSLVAQAVTNNSDKYPIVIVSEQDKKIIQGPLVWTWE